MNRIVWLQNNSINQYFQPYYFSQGAFHTSLFLHLYLIAEYTFRWKAIYFFEWYAVEGDHSLSRFMASSAGSSSHLFTRLDASSRPSSFVLSQSQLRFRAGHVRTGHTRRCLAFVEYVSHSTRASWWRAFWRALAEFLQFFLR